MQYDNFKSEGGSNEPPFYNYWGVTLRVLGAHQSSTKMTKIASRSNIFLKNKTFFIVLHKSYNMNTVKDLSFLSFKASDLETNNSKSNFPIVISAPFTGSTSKRSNNSPICTHM